MSNFQGWLLKFGGTVLPNELINYEGWKATPNQRLEIEATRNANADLLRVTAKNTKTTIEITTIPFTGEQKAQFMNVINSGIVDSLQRKADIIYWNDETERYEEGYFYIPDITWTLKKINPQSFARRYNSVTVKFIEY